MSKINISKILLDEWNNIYNRNPNDLKLASDFLSRNINTIDILRKEYYNKKGGTN
jgi:hypothetical protein